MDNIKIIMDERERGKIRLAFDYIQKKTTRGIEIKMETLECGDFIISDRIGIERKRGDDLVASIFDNRFFHQIIALEENFKIPILVIENPKYIFAHSKIKESSIYGALIYSAMKIGVFIIPTQNEKETAQLICNLAEIEQNYQYLEDSGSEGQNTGIKEKFHKDKEINQEDQLFFLEGLTQVGNIKAQILLKNFKTPEIILHALKESKVIYDEDNKPKKILGLLSHIKGFGPKFLHRNKLLLETPHDLSKKNKINTFD